eukprot:TRINITY_DN8347_c0_g1_i1.p1 TRINITY_DN8347_c0_g1~~TRINITY_DN8347_c0_g1_i1.p1  ORF type:complete len:981 (-),score=273.25 TRINITY_DN8347_c0_g1_i1:18-2960(-)
MDKKEKHQSSLSPDKEKDIRSKLGELPYTYTQYEFNPFSHVLNIVKSENKKQLKSDLDMYCKWMDEARRVLVEVDFKSLNEVIRNYTNILDYLAEMKSNEDKLKSSTEQTIAFFRLRNQEVNSLHERTLQYKYMVSILDKIEGIKKVPGLYSEKISKEMFLEAAKHLITAFKDLKEDNLSNIRALNDLKNQILQERDVFHIAIVEIIHNKIYLKTEKASRVVMVSEDDGKGGFTRIIKYNQKDNQNPLLEKKENTRITRVLDDQDGKKTMISLVEACYQLDKVAPAINEITRRISEELREVIQDCIIACNKDRNLIRAREMNNKSRKSDMLEAPTSHFAFILKALFKTLKTILSNHQFICNEFQGRREKADSENNQLTALSYTEDNSPQNIYNIEEVWKEFQIELKALIGIHIGAKDAIISATSSEDLSGPKLFSFAASSAFTEYEAEKQETTTYADFDLGEAPSPFNITPIYPLIVNFSDNIVNTISSKDPASLCVLKNWVDNFVKNVFLPHIKTAYKERQAHFNEGIQSSQPQKSKQVYQSGAERPLLNSAIEINKCLIELYNDVISMPEPHYVTEFHQIMSELLSNYLTACKTRINSLLEKTETGALLKNEKFKQFVMTDPRYRQIVYDTNFAVSAIPRTNIFQSYQQDMGKASSRGKVTMVDDEDKDKYDEQEKVQEAPAYDGKRISDPTQDLQQNIHLFPKQDLSHNLTILATMHDSLSWLVKNLHELGKPKSSKKGDDVKDSNLQSAPYKSKVQQTLLTKVPNINVDMRRYAEELRRLADIALLAIRIELRLWTFCYLDLMRGVQYVYVPDVNNDRADVFVTDLNKYLSQAYETLSCYLPTEKVRYIFADLPSLTAQILFNSLHKIQDGKIDKYGISRMKKNTFAFQTIFHNMNILDTDYKEFEKVRKFYSLLEMKQQDLLAQVQKDIAERSTAFSLEEIIKILQFLSPNKKLAAPTLNYLQTLYSTTTTTKIQ